MSTNSELMARLERLGPVRVVPPPPAFSGAPVALVLRLEYPMDKPVSLVKRLYAAGLTMRAAKDVMDRLGETRLAVCAIHEGADISALAADLAAMNVFAYRRRHPKASSIAEVRAHHRMSPAEFAEVLGLDLETLRDWEEGRREPGAAALSLVLAFDEAPDAVCAATLERVAI